MRGYIISLGNFQPEKGICYSVGRPPSQIGEPVTLPDIVAAEFEKRERVTVTIGKIQRKNCPLHCVWVKDGVITDRSYQYA